MDYLDEFFATVMADTKYSTAVRAAVGLGKRHLNRYYGLTDAFPACKIALRKCYLCCLCYLLPYSLPAVRPPPPLANFPFHCLLAGQSADLISAVLHPARRLAYFKRLRWEPKWIDELVQKTRDILEADYAAVEEVLPERTPETSVLSDNVSMSPALQSHLLMCV